RETTVSGLTLSPEQIGIGMRIGIHPHSDDYERIILEALETTSDQLDLTGLEITTGEVSTYVGGKTGAAAQQLADYATTLIASASRASTRQHVTSHLFVRRGCPGEATCELLPGEIPVEQTVALEKTGLEAAAAWSLYPLADDGSAHMDPIYAAIGQAKAAHRKNACSWCLNPPVS